MLRLDPKKSPKKISWTSRGGGGVHLLTTMNRIKETTEPKIAGQIPQIQLSSVWYFKYPRIYQTTQLTAPPIIPVIPACFVPRGHHNPKRNGNVKAEAIKLKDIVTIHKMAAGGLRATRSARIPVTRVTSLAIRSPFRRSISLFMKWT